MTPDTSLGETTFLRKYALPRDALEGKLAGLAPRISGARYVVFGWGARDYYMARNPDHGDCPARDDTWAGGGFGRAVGSTPGSLGWTAQFHRVAHHRGRRFGIVGIPVGSRR